PEAEVDRVLRQLRLDVGALLENGQVEEAEALMEQRRRELEERGVLFRRINQAFFASRSVYGTDPASISPLGEQVLELRDRTGSAGPFLRTASGLTSGAELERLLEALDQGRR
ncbi:MAG: hypothetical protein U1B78_03150, partial [Dehalococcoidia bacterium]|nr:hypothetical protein [Dehalococcoidia bacterium]